MNRTPKGNATVPSPDTKSQTPPNPSRLGDPTSLKAETAETQPTQRDRGGSGADAKGDSPEKKQLSLKEAAMRNPTALGDPVSLKAEKSDTEVTEGDRGALRDSDEVKRRRSKL